ncbi:EAL domain-containing protein [Oceanospirillum beijerinckii]|uniref:EAL domain-containing protein n=1 Tax=Oceanospirillum beijerinckii TaxID=64976 RepID=UPI00040CCD96|nr:EAL domain-containing protein [Oceanospirillum beijerinckii]
MSFNLGVKGQRRKVIVHRTVCQLAALMAMLLCLSASALAKSPAVELTAAEKQWLQNHQSTIRLGVSYVPPHTMIKDEAGRYRGVAMDFLYLIEKKLNITFEPKFFPSYSAMLQAARDKEVDIVFAASETPERLKYLDFTQPYTFLSNKIFVRKTSPEYQGLDQLAGKSVAVIRGTAVAEYLKAQFPAINLVELKSSRDVIVALSSGNADAAISVVASAWMHIKSEGISNVEVVGDAHYSYAVRFASRNDWPVLNQILEKALYSFSDKEKDDIHRLWLYPEKDEGIDPELVTRYAIIIALVFLIGLLLSAAYWIRRLRLEVDSRLRSEAALKASEERFELAIRGTNDGIWDWDLCSNQLYLAPRVQEILSAPGNSEQGLVQNGLEPWLNKVHPMDISLVQSGVDQHLQQKVPLDVEYRMKNSRNEWVWLRMRGQAQWGSNDSPVRLCGSIMDITRTKRADEEVRRLAYFDNLTGIPNRERFKITLQGAVNKLNTTGQGFAVLFIDLDHFKVINDSLGHRIGDLLLNHVAQQLRDLLPPSNFIGRLGGDEFAILMEGTIEGAQVERWADEILLMVARPLKLDGHDIRTTASIGISLCQQAPIHLDTVMEQADIALFEVKRQQRGQYRFHSPEMSQKMIEATALANDLEQAQDRGELFLVFQPQVHLKEERLIGCEALLRWKHPERGFISPGQFIPLAEERGLIHQLGDWVLYQACTQAKRWLEQGVAFQQIGINVSSLQLLEPQFVERVYQVLQELELPAHCIELEITETVLMKDISVAEQAMRSLNKLGVNFSIDDFGTGYSSLRYLHKLPIKRLKLAQEFVRDMAPDDEGAVIAATLQLGRNLNIPVIAEGIETFRHFEQLREQGCDQGQGYLFARPMARSEFEDFVAKSQQVGVLPEFSDCKEQIMEVG